MPKEAVKTENTMTVSNDDVRKVAKLARIALPEDQVEPMTRRAMSLDQFLPGPLRQLDRLAAALSVRRPGKN